MSSSKNSWPQARDRSNRFHPKYLFLMSFPVRQGKHHRRIIHNWNIIITAARFALPANYSRFKLILIKTGLKLGSVGYFVVVVVVFVVVYIQKKPFASLKSKNTRRVTLVFPNSVLFHSVLCGIMVSIAVSISLPLTVWERTRELKINRSAIARRAIEAELNRIENNAGAIAAKQTTPTADLSGGQDNVSRSG